MIKVIAVGKIKDKWLKDGIDEYLKRLKAYDKIEIIETTDLKVPESNSDKENEIVKVEEGRKVLKQVKDDEYVILLDLKGNAKDSISMAKYIQNLYDTSRSKITFIIGGSLGVSDEVKKRANYMWKLAEVTLPHQLCRLVVLEQIYRCFRINHNEPYHK